MCKRESIVTWLLLVVVVATSSGAKIKSDEGKSLFEPGKQYNYHYETLVTTGTEEPVSFSSSYRLKGKMHVQAPNADSISVKLDNVSIGLYNGRWSYFPVPEFANVKSEDLNYLSEPFQINFEKGKFKTLVMNDQEPEWASNIKRGFATYLQMDMEKVSISKLQTFRSKEYTTMGECSTSYEVMPISTTKTGLARISKFRNHADCPDIPTRTQYGTRTAYPCSDKYTRDIFNSSSYVTYDIVPSKGTQFQIQKITVLSSILYWPFTTTSTFHYSWFNMTLALENIAPIGTPIPQPENMENHEDLTYVFEQSDFTDPEEEITDVKGVDPAFFHHTTADADPEVLQEIQEKLLSKITEVATVFENSDSDSFNNNDFHKNSPMNIMMLVSSLDYEHLKQCYSKLSLASNNNAQSLSEYRLYLDALIQAGTSASSLLVRDIVLSNDDFSTLWRLTMGFPHYIRYPSETLAKELEPMFDVVKKESLDKITKRTIELSWATVVGRSCKNLCPTSGLLDKYVGYFEKKLKDAKSFDDQTTAVLGLRNLVMGKAMDKVLQIAEGKISVEPTVRVQAIWSLRALIYREPDRVFGALMPVFFNRTEPCEVRTSVFGFLMGSKPSERILHEIVYFMWTETCPQTMNLVRSTLTLMANSVHPCNQIGSYARTILKYLPPGKIDPTRTASYGFDYYDKRTGLGQLTHLTVQKSGKAALPLTYYIGSQNYAGGFGNFNYGIFVRLQGLGDAVADKLAQMGGANIEDIERILSKVGVEKRPVTPLRLEYTLMQHNSAVFHAAIDEKSLLKLPILMKTIMALMNNGTSFAVQNSVMLSGTLYQQPLEIGTPVSLWVGASLFSKINGNVTIEKSASAVSDDVHSKIGMNIFGASTLTNHIPGIGVSQKISLHRTMRYQLPTHASSLFDMKESKLEHSLYPPTESTPAFALFHATTITSVSGDAIHPMKDGAASDILKQSCPSCQNSTIVSRGPEFRKSREMVTNVFPSVAKGIKYGIRYYDCERDHSKMSMVQNLKSFFSDDGKNSGFFDNPALKLLLSLQKAQDFIFYSPFPETCSLSEYLYQDSSAPTRLTKIDTTGKFSKKEEKSSQKMSLNAKLTFNYEGQDTAQKKIQLDLAIANEAYNKQIGTLKVMGWKHIMCVETEDNTNKLTPDGLSVTGDNEPYLNQSMVIRVGQFAKGDSRFSGDIKDAPCLDNYAKIKFIGSAKRSEEQKQALISSNVSPYAECQAQKTSPAHSGKFTPPSDQCFQVAVDQTNLRIANVTATYKLSEEADKKMRRSFLVWGGVFAPYLVEENEDKSHEHGNDHTHATGLDRNKMLSGEIEFDLNVKTEGPVMDVHFVDSYGKELHFHEIDFAFVPEFLKPQPIPTRFSPLVMLGFQAGAFGHCSVTPNTVYTLDKFSYAAKLTDCLTLISADCSENPQYTVLGKKLSSDEIGVVIYLGEHNITLEGRKANPIVDGKETKFPEKEIYRGGGQDLNSFKVFKNGDEVYVFSLVHGVTVRYTGSFVGVILGSRYRGVHCGLCGTWDSSLYNDLAGPKSCSRPLGPEDMMKAYVVREGACTKIGKECP